MALSLDNRTQRLRTPATIRALYCSPRLCSKLTSSQRFSTKYTKRSSYPVPPLAADAGCGGAATAIIRRWGWQSCLSRPVRSLRCVCIARHVTVSATRKQRENNGTHTIAVAGNDDAGQPKRADDRSEGKEGIS